MKKRRTSRKRVVASRKRTAKKAGRRKVAQKRNKLGQFVSTKKRGKSAKRRRR